MSLLGALLALLIATVWQVGWLVAHQRRHQTFEVRVADVLLTVNRETRKVTCHTLPTEEQLAVIVDWVKNWEDVERTQSRFRVLRPLR